MGIDFDHVLRTIDRSAVHRWEIFDDGLHTLNRVRTAQLARLSDKAETVYSVHGPICDLNLATLNPEVRPQVVQRMERSLRNAASLGAKTWVLHPGIHGALSWVHPGVDWKANLSNIQRLQRLGKNLRVEVTIENISAGAAVLSHVRDFGRLYRELPDAPSMTLDVGHSHLKGETQGFLTKHGKKIRHIHIHDNKGDFDTHLAVGSGVIRWRETMQMILDSGFEGDLIIESVKGPFASLARVKKLLRSLQ